MGLTRDDLRTLLDAFETSTWQEMTVEVGGDRIHVSRREGEHPPGPARATNGHTSAPPSAPVPDVERPDPPDRISSPNEPPPNEPPPAATGAPVVSPSVGLFWRAPSPDSPPFVEVGTRVTADDTIGIVEVMKLMTPVPAGRAGTVTAVLADNGAMVEHGQPLVLIGE